MPEVPALPEPHEPAPPMPNPSAARRSVNTGPIILAAVIGGGTCLLAVIIGMVVLGVSEAGVNEVATTGLSAIGATLAGGFAGWIARGQATPREAPRRSTDPPVPPEL